MNLSKPITPNKNGVHLPVISPKRVDSTSSSLSSSNMATSINATPKSTSRISTPGGEKDEFENGNNIRSYLNSRGSNKRNNVVGSGGIGGLINNLSNYSNPSENDSVSIQQKSLKISLSTKLLNFPTSVPIASRGLIDVFGISRENDFFEARSKLRTPPDVREKIAHLYSKKAFMIKKIKPRKQITNHQNEISNNSIDNSTLISQADSSVVDIIAKSVDSDDDCTVSTGASISSTLGSSVIGIVENAENWVPSDLYNKKDINEEVVKSTNNEQLKKNIHIDISDPTIYNKLDNDYFDDSTYDNSTLLTNPTAFESKNNEEAMFQEKMDELYLEFPEHNKFCGSNAKKEFQESLKLSLREYYNWGTDDINIPEERKTPRTLYLREQNKSSLIQLPLIIRKSNEIDGIYLPNKGLGDQHLIPIINIIETLPNVKKINLRDNRLTDISLMPLALKLPKLTNLVYLDLSFNKMDDSSETLKDFLSSPDCKLHTLLLNGADVDDFECGHLCEALIENKSIHTLGLNTNKIGDLELLNVVMPDLETGGEALAAMLRLNKTITSLDLAYNSIRLSSAEDFGDALSSNNTLKILKLNDNAFGDLGTQELGKGLRNNKGLKELNLANNSLTPKAASVFFYYMQYNTTLELVNLDGNRIGRLGAQSMVAAMEHAQTILVTFPGCDCKSEDRDLFDPLSPCGQHVLDLSEPYGQMVAAELLYIANYVSGYVITEWEQGNESIIFERAKLILPLKLLNIADYELLIKQISANILANKIDTSVPQMKKLFDLFTLKFPSNNYIIDVLKRVNTNWMNKHNLPDCMELLEEVLLKEIFYSIYQITDINDVGDIDLNEFLLILEQLGRKNFDRDKLQEMINRYDADCGLINISEFSLVMIYEICLVKPEKTNLVNKKTSKPLIIPNSGRCRIVMESICEDSSLRQVASKGGFDCVLKNIHQTSRSDEKEIIFDHITLSPYFRLDCKQATHLFTLMSHGGELSHIERIIAIIPNIVNVEHRLIFCENVLDPNGRLKLRDTMGQCYNAFFGCPSGHYLLDLKNKNHIECSKLLAIESIGNMNYCEKVGTNCGQRGNYSQFRNEELLSCPTWKAGPFVILTGKWFESKPNDGQLRFDYFSMKRLKIGTFPISDQRFQKLLDYLELDEIDKIFKENVKRKELLSIPPISVVRMKESWFEYMSSSHKYHDVFPPERVRFQISVHDENSEENKDDDESVESVHSIEEKSSKTVAKVLAAADLFVHPCFPLLYKKLFQLQVAMSKLPGLSVAQICLILEKFPQVEGTCFIRVQILQSCWDRIVDVKNIYIIYDKYLNEESQKEAIHRIGPLNLFDPTNPDRHYVMDLRKYEFKELAKLLIQLKINEPGDTWFNQSYKWTFNDPIVPGWMLPKTWLTAAGMRKDGWLSTSYRSTGPNCDPNVEIRKELRRKTLSGMKWII